MPGDDLNHALSEVNRKRLVLCFQCNIPSLAGYADDDLEDDEAFLEDMEREEGGPSAASTAAVTAESAPVRLSAPLSYRQVHQFCVGGANPLH